MKKFISFLLIFFSSNLLQAQNTRDFLPVIPEKSTLFADDIYINDQPTQNQHSLAMCSTFNGWLFAVYTFQVGTVPWIAVLKSIDNGKTWSVINSGNLGFAGDYSFKMDLVSCGNDTSNLKLFIGIGMFRSISHNRTVHVSRFNCSTNLPEGDILNEPSQKVWDFALSTDNLYPANNSNPNSIAIFFSKEYGYYPVFRDTLIFRSSSNGGISFDFQEGGRGTASSIHKVDLAYGRSSTYSSGRYFAAWEEKLDSNDASGHIYTAHTEPNFNSSFTTPHLLDSEASLNNKVRNPAIACQFSGSDNDSSNLTEVVLCEKYISAEQRSDIVGFYNKTATNSNNFNTLSINSGQNNNLQPDISFNPFDMTFMATYFDSTNQKLPYIRNDANLSNPNSWSIISSGYNDSSNLKKPYPKIKLALGQQSGANFWIADRSNGNGAAMFDAPFNYPVGIKGNELQPITNLFRVFPNPATTITTIEFQLEDNCDVRISLTNSFGQLINDKILRSCPKGKSMSTIDLSQYPEGIYVINFSTGNSSDNKKIIIK